MAVDGKVGIGLTRLDKTVFMPVLQPNVQAIALLILIGYRLLFGVSAKLVMLT